RTLVDQTRQINGVSYQRVSEQYKILALGDASAVAVDQGDFMAYVSLWERHCYSIFISCLLWLDGFAVGDDCTACVGGG
ncbi:hypothetical protein RA276_32355, partial [Pseudomonas syringae pv. tagetis]